MQMGPKIMSNLVQESVFKIPPIIFAFRNRFYCAANLHIFHIRKEMTFHMSSITY